MKCVTMTSALLAAATSSAAAQAPLPQSCISAIDDAATPGTCIHASSVPTAGHLLPLGPEIFVTPDGRVGINNEFPDSSLQLDVTGNFRCNDMFSDDIVCENVFGSDVILQGAVPEVVLRDPEGDTKIWMLRGSTGTDEWWGEVFRYGDSEEVIQRQTVQAQSANAGWNGTFNGASDLVWISSYTGDPFSGAVGAFTGNLNVCGLRAETGEVYGIYKSFIQPHPTDATKEIKYVASEGNEHGVFTRGTATLVDGTATVELPADFQMVTRGEGLTVSLTPLGLTRGVYVAEKSTEKLIIAEFPGGSGSVEVDYVVMGERSALPKLDPIVPNIHFAPTPGTDMRLASLPQEYVALMIKNGTLNPDGTVNVSSALRQGWTLDAESGQWTGGPEGALAGPRR